jgi:hypothetical protein
MIPGTRLDRGERLLIVMALPQISDTMLNVHFRRTAAPKEGSTAEREIAEAIAKLVQRPLQSAQGEVKQLLNQSLTLLLQPMILNRSLGRHEMEAILVQSEIKPLVQAEF